MGIEGGRFPSDMQIPRSTAFSAVSDNSEPELVPAAALISSPVEEYERRGADPYRLDGVDTGSRPASRVPSSEPQQTHLPPQQDSAAQELPATPLPQHNAAEDVAVPLTAAAAVGVGAEALDTRRENAEELDKQVAMEEGQAGPVESLEEHDTAKVLLDAPGTTQVPATIPPPLTTADPAATVVPAPLIADATLTRPSASVVTPAPDAPAARSSSTQAVKNAPLVSQPPLGGLEKEGAHETGRMPMVIRHDTDISISRLHVPGEFK